MNRVTFLIKGFCSGMLFLLSGCSSIYLGVGDKDHFSPELQSS